MLSFPLSADALMLPGEVAALFGVELQALYRWGNLGLIPFILTPGGHRRYRAAEVAELWRTAQERGRP